MTKSLPYLATFEESVTLLGDLFDEGFRIVLARTYAAPEAPEYGAVGAALVELLHEGPAFFVVGAFTTSPVPFVPLKSGPAAGRYAIDALAQGPVIEGCLARERVVDGTPTLLAGNFCRQSRLRAPDGAWVPPTAALEAAYRTITMLARRRVQKDPRLVMPIGPDARRRFDAGEAQVRPEYLRAAVT